MAKLIADSGSTKTDWCLIQANDETVRYSTIGLNPYFLNTDEIASEINDTLKSRLKEYPTEVHFYGAGCANTDKRRSVEEALQQCFPNSLIIVDTDLLGAARALCGKEAGIASILGTGSNSCYYDGKEIVNSVPSLGYILGDEGSGAYLGKQLLKAYVYNELPNHLQEAFSEEYQLNRDHIVEAVYRKPLPNRFLASFAPFLKKNEADLFIQAIVYEAFNSFIKHHIHKYKTFGKHKLHATGSIAWHFSEILQKTCTDNNIELGTVLQSPMEGLITYHKQ